MGIEGARIHPNILFFVVVFVMVDEITGFMGGLLGNEGVATGAGTTSGL